MRANLSIYMKTLRICSHSEGNGRKFSVVFVIRRRHSCMSLRYFLFCHYTFHYKFVRLKIGDDIIHGFIYDSLSSLNNDVCTFLELNERRRSSLENIMAREFWHTQKIISTSLLFLCFSSHDDSAEALFVMENSRFFFVAMRNLFYMCIRWWIHV